MLVVLHSAPQKALNILSMRSPAKVERNYFQSDTKPIILVNK